MKGPFSFDPCSDRILLAQRRLRAGYACTPSAEAAVVDPGCGYGRRYAFRELFDDLDKMLEHATHWANALAACDNDWPPFIDTYCGVVMVPEAFGCRVMYTEGHDPWTEPALPDVSGVWALKPRRPAETPTLRRLSEWVDYAQRRLGTEVPIWTLDIQSPFSVAARVVEPQELLAACYTDPKAVHHLCGMIADYSIEVMQAHIAQMENPGFPGRNFPSIPDRIGVCIADDTPLVMLSPDMYREFALPYNSRIGEAFGGVHIHRCGDYRHNLDNICDITNVRSTQLHAGPSEFPLPASAQEPAPFNRVRRRLCCFVDSNPIAMGDTYRGHPRRHYAEYVLPRLLNERPAGLIVQSCGPGEDMSTAAAALDWTRAAVR